MEALVHSSEVQQPIAGDPWGEALRFPCTISVELGIDKFTLRDLLSLTRGSVVASATPEGSDIPVRANTVLIGWGEFEVVSNTLAVRLTDLSA